MQIIRRSLTAIGNRLRDDHRLKKDFRQQTLQLHRSVAGPVPSYLRDERHSLTPPLYQSVSLTNDRTLETGSSAQLLAPSLDPHALTQFVPIALMVVVSSVGIETADTEPTRERKELGSVVDKKADWFAKLADGRRKT